MREAEATKAKGYVDVKKAKVAGIFSQYEHDLYMNPLMLFRDWGLLPPETTAVHLHETGHIFTTIEYSDRLESCNLILSNIASSLMGDRGKMKTEYVYRELSKVNDKVTEEEADKLVNGSAVIAGLTYFKVVIGSIQTQMAECTYDKTSSEALADNFASRFKYGRPLISGLEKITKYHGFSAEKSKAWYTFRFVFSVCSMFVLPMAAVALLTAGMIGPGFWFFYIWVMTFYLAREDVRDYTYDELKNRYKRIRSDMVELLKDPKLEKEALVALVTDIEYMDKVIDDTMIFKGPFRLVSNFLFSGASAARASVLEQQILEELASNDMFLLSAKIKANL